MRNLFVFRTDPLSAYRYSNAVLPVALAVLLAACGGRAATPTPFPTPTPTPAARQVVLPQDDAPHPGFNTEWWYYHGHLQAASGERYSFHYVVFDIVVPGIRPQNVYQLAITDHQEKRYITDQRRVDGMAKQPGGRGFAYMVEGGRPQGAAPGGTWVISGSNGVDRLVGSAGGYEIDLRLEQANPPAIHGGTGWLDFARMPRPSTTPAHG